MKKRDLVDALADFEIWVDSMRSLGTMTRIDHESVYVHGAFAEYCQDCGIRDSPSAPFLREMNGKVETLFGVVINMTRALKKTHGLSEKYWHLTIFIMLLT